MLWVPAPERASLLLSPCSSLSLPQGLVLLSLTCSPTEIHGNFQRKRVSSCSSLRKIICVNKQYFWPSQNNWLLCLPLLGRISAESKAVVCKPPEWHCSTPLGLRGRTEGAEIWECFLCCSLATQVYFFSGDFIVCLKWSLRWCYRGSEVVSSILEQLGAQELVAVLMQSRN